MSALKVKIMEENGKKRINFFAHLLCSAIFAYGCMPTSQQSFRQMSLAPLFTQWETLESLGFVLGQLRQSFFPFFLSDMGNQRDWSLSYPREPKYSVWHEIESQQMMTKGRNHLEDGFLIQEPGWVHHMYLGQ